MTDDMISRLISDDEAAELSVLVLANENGKFALDVAYKFSEDRQILAFERGLIRDWYRLIDLSVVTRSKTNRLFRVFLLTPAGRERLAELGRKVAAS